MAMLKCMFCKTPQKGDRGVRAILCSSCVAKLAGSPQAIGKFPKPQVKKEKKAKVKKAKVVSAAKGFGRGWHLKKKFVAPDGTVYSFGQLVPTKKRGGK